MKKSNKIIVGVCVIIFLISIPFIQNKMQYNNLYEAAKVYELDNEYNKNKLIVRDSDIDKMKNDIYEIQKVENSNK